jgi:hypothetical protein
MKMKRTARSPQRTEAVVKMTAFWDVVPWSLVEVDRRFRSAYCLHHRPDEEGSTYLRIVSLLL